MFPTGNGARGREYGSWHWDVTAVIVTVTPVAFKSSRAYNVSFCLWRSKAPGNATQRHQYSLEANEKEGRKEKAADLAATKGQRSSEKKKEKEKAGSMNAAPRLRVPHMRRPLLSVHQFLSVFFSFEWFSFRCFCCVSPRRQFAKMK